MDNETREMLGLILNKITGLEEGQRSLEEGQRSLEEGQQSLRADVRELQKDMKSVKGTVNKTAVQVDRLYNWVDSIDLKTKKNTEVLENLSLFK